VDTRLEVDRALGLAAPEVHVVGVAGLGWHLVYLAGISGSAAFFASTPSARRRRVGLGLLGGLAVTAVGVGGNDSGHPHEG
jgi:hypothetical protein